MNEDLRKWFSQKWVRMDTKGNIKGDCAREPGEGKPKCLPLARASAMDKEDRAAAARRKRREDPVADRAGKGSKPINVSTMSEQTMKSLDWKNKEPADYAIHLSKFFGQPDSITDEELVWESKDGFKRIVVKDEYILHSSPAPHYDFIYCYVDLIVPVKYATALAESSGSILIDFLKGEVGARCGSITANATTINYVLDVVAGRVKPSKEEYEKRILSMTSMFSRGKKFELDWWPDETKDADPSNPYYKESTNEHFNHCGCDVIQEVSTSELIKKSHSKRGAPGTLKAKIKGPLTLAKVRSLKNRANATTLDKKQANFYINMQSEEYLEEKNVPTNPALWARAKTLARSKFDVYPSAYANGWAAKWYKGKGGSWKSVQEGTKMKTLNDILAEGVAVSSDFKLVNSVNAQGKPITRKVRAHRKTISPQSNESEEKPDVLTSIQKFVGRQYDEEVEQVDEVDSKTLASFLKKNPGYKVDTRSTKERKAASKERSADQMKRGEPTKIAPASKADVDKQIAKSYSQHKSGQYVGDSVELEGEIIEASQSPSMRMFKALQKIKQQRETEEARKKENEKRALTPKQTNEAKDPREYDYEGDMAKTQLRSIIANSQAVHDMLKDTTNLAEWVQSKITKAEDYISTVADYMTAEMNEQHVLEAKKEEDDEEDYSKNHKLDPDSGVEADQHIHVQLKKAIDSTMKPYEVSFKNGKKHSVSSPVAKTIVTAIEKLKPEHRKAAHDELHKSYDSLMGVHKAITGK
jgi:hypothetical protein